MDRKESKPVAGDRVRHLVNEVLGKDYIALTSHVSNNKCAIYHKPTATLVMKEARNTHMIPRLEQMSDGRRDKIKTPRKGLGATGKDPWKMLQWLQVGWLQASINLDLDELRKARPGVQIVVSRPIFREGKLKLVDTGFRAFYREEGEEKVIAIVPHAEGGKKVLDADQNAVNRVEGKMTEIIDVMEGEVRFKYFSGVLSARTPDGVMIASKGYHDLAKEKTQ